MTLYDAYMWGARYAALVHALRITRGNRRAAALLLGVQRNAVYVALQDLVRPR